MPDARGERAHRQHSIDMHGPRDELAPCRDVPNHGQNGRLTVEVHRHRGRLDVNLVPVEANHGQLGEPRRGARVMKLRHCGEYGRMVRWGEQTQERLADEALRAGRSQQRRRRAIRMRHHALSIDQDSIGNQLEGGAKTRLGGAQRALGERVFDTHLGVAKLPVDGRHEPR